MIASSLGDATAQRQFLWIPRLASAASFILAFVFSQNLIVTAGLVSCSLILAFLQKASSDTSQRLFCLILGGIILLASVAGLLLARSEPGFGISALFVLLSAGSLNIATVNQGRRKVFAFFFIPLVTLISFLSLVGSVYGAHSLDDIELLRHFPWPQALCFFILSIGSLFLCEQSHGSVRILTSHEIGGTLARRVLPFVIVAPVFLGWVTLRLQTQGYLSSELETSILVLSLCVTLTLVVLFTAGKLNRLERERKNFSDREQAIKEQFIEILNHSPLIIWSLDKEGNYTLSEGKALETLHLQPNEFVGKNHFEFYKDNPDVIRNVERAFRGEAFTGESRIQDRIFSTNYVPIRDEEGRVSGMTAVSNDVTELKTAQLELISERENLRNLFRQTPEMVVILKGPEHLFEFVNEAHVVALGFNATGKTVREAQPESVEIHGILDEVYRTGVTAHLHEIPITLGESVRYFDLTYAARHNQKHEIDGIMILGMEITSQVESRKALEESESKYRTSEQEIIDILESMSDAFFSVDKNWTITRVNAQHVRATRYSREEQIGANFINLFLSDPSQERSKYMLNYQRVMKDRVPVSFEDYYEPFDLWTLVRAYPTGDGGFAAFFTDTTIQKKNNQRVEAEKQKLEAIFFEAPVLMALLRGPDFVYEKVNPRYRELVGGRELLGKTLLEALPELTSQPFRDLMKQVYETGKTYIGKETLSLLVRKIGDTPTEVYFDFAYVRVLDGEGRPYGIYIHASDVTDKVLARHRLEQISADLEEAVRARDDFLSIASHELKTPLTSLKLQSQILQRRVKKNDPQAYLKERVDEIAEQTDKQVSRLNRLVDDMLDISRIRSGNLLIQREKLDLNELVKDVSGRMQTQFQQTNSQTPTVHIESAVVGDWDKFRLEQVVTNLLTNAMRYGRGKPIDLKVATVGHTAHLTVSDQGMGIAKANQEKIFDRFERAVNASEVSGLGLGLFITKQIVKAHGGKIWVESELDHGSTFHVELPIQKPTGESPEVPHVL